MPRNDKHGILLNLEPELHAAITAAAKAHSVSNSEYIRQAVKLRLAKSEPPAADLFSIQTPDKTATDYWLERIRIWGTMAGADAMADLDAATNGVRPPAELFGSATELAKWLEENATK